MKLKIAIILLIFILPVLCCGCDINALHDAIFDEESDRDKLSADAFEGANFDSEFHISDMEINDYEAAEGERYESDCDVDCGLAVWEVTEKNRCFVYKKFGIDSIGVIIFHSENSNKLQFGDRMLEIEGIKINSPRDIDEIIKNYKVGQTVKVTVDRKGERVVVDLLITERLAEKVRFD